MMLAQATTTKEPHITDNKSNCRDVTNKVAFLYSKASTNIPPKSGPKKNPVANVVVNMPESAACLPAPLLSFSKSGDSKMVDLSSDKHDVNCADNPIPFKKSAAMHNGIEVGVDMNGAGPINIEEVIINIVPIMAIGIPFSFL